MNPLTSVRLDEVTSRKWDAVVIGAGPAGALTARELARRGLAVLLADKARFPRDKVCGCCLNLRALAALEAVGLGDLPARHGGTPLKSFRVGWKGATAELPLPGGFALSRGSFDQALVEEAQRSGAAFASEAVVSLVESGSHDVTLRLRCRDTSKQIRTQVIVAADGLNGRICREVGIQGFVHSESRIGAATLAPCSAEGYPSGTIHMACGQGGYVGLVRVENGRLNMAAAFDPEFVKANGGLAPSAAWILAETGFPPIANLEDLSWKGTPGLTRRSSDIAAHRLFAVGDAAGYVEPFTGEGMAWALTGAIALSPIVARAIERYSPATLEEWRELHRRTVKRRLGLCRVTAFAVRRPRLVGWTVALLSARPGLAQPFIYHLNKWRTIKGFASP